MYSLEAPMTLSPLTPKQRKMLDFLTEAITQQGYAPSFEEIAAAEAKEKAESKQP